MNRDESQVLMHGYLDGELDPASSLTFESHLASCKDCAKEFERYKDLGAAVRNTAEYFTAPQELRTAITAQLRPSPSKAACDLRPARQRGGPLDRRSGRCWWAQSPRC
jgi:anti-sigma factor RsiW